VIVDAHHHLWDPAARRHAWLDQLPRIRRPFLLADFQAVAAAEGVTASVLVQVLASAEETAEFLALAAGRGGMANLSVAGRTAGAGGVAGLAAGATGVAGLAAGDAGVAGLAAGDAGVAGLAAGAGGVAGQPVIAGVVGWADLTRADISDEIGRLRGLPGGGRLVGLRHLVQDEPDPGWLSRPDVKRGLRAAGAAGLAFDLLLRPAQLPAALRTAAELSDVRFVLDHGAKPEIAAGRTQPWADLVAALAELPNVTCKLSGLVTEAGPGWRTADFLPYTNRLLDSFGPRRLMFGSDWPVCTLAASYHEVLALARAALGGRLSPAELDAVFGANAVTAYRLRA
jgi:L-fuconolactonase